MLMTGGRVRESIGANQFGRQLSEHLAELRQALRRMLAELGSPATPTALQRQLGVGYTICWQLFQVARGDDEGAGTQHAPSLGALKRLIGPAQARGVSPETTNVLQAAADRFHRFVREHAEDRDYFDSIVASASPSNNTKSLLVQRRRAAYRANSHVWGLQNDLWMVTAIVRRSATDPKQTDSVVLSRQQGLRRIRADATVYLMAMKVDVANVHSPSGHDDPLKHALDPVAAAATGMPILPEYTTQPLPRVRCRTTDSGRRLFSWADDSVGLKSSCDITTGTANLGLPMILEPDGRRQIAATSAARNKPSALLVLDLLVHRESFPGAHVQAMVHEAISEVGTLDEVQSGHQFAIEEDVRNLGPADGLNLAEFPSYRELLEKAARRVDWNLAEFDAYRLRVPYPIMGAAHRLFFFDTVA